MKATLGPECIFPSYADSLGVSREKQAKWRASDKRKETARKKRFAPIAVLIEILSLRNQLDDPLTRAEVRIVLRPKLADAQFRFEKLMIQRLGLDHLHGIEVYGIKQKPSFRSALQSSTPALP